MKNNLIETLVGTAVLALAAIFVIYGYSVTNMAPRQGYVLSASFDRVDGLSIGSDVRMSGIKVGTVIEQTLNPETFYAEVKLQINDEILLPDDTSAKITMEGLLGGNYISLTPGGSLDNLENGDELIYTQGSVDLIGLVSQALFSAEESGGE
ncbi:MAG: outer membrane lipid asymmetry maintenance protein MlaD [Parvibaculales bacterium]